MHPCGTQSKYASGCRCSDCRAEHAKVYRERRHRKAAGIPSDYDRVNPSSSREAIQWMRDEGMRWSQIEGLTGFERVSLQRIMLPTKKNVAVSTQRTLLDTMRRIKANPELLTRDALLLPGAWTRWQFGALLARGWTSDLITEKSGVHPPRLGMKVQRRTAEAIDALFERWHADWGPSRKSAVAMWRKGTFPADCYLWEDQDTRPIPGSLRPELVVEALTFSPAHRKQADPIRARFREFGQWPKAICARTAMHLWNKALGHPVEDYEAEPPTEAWVKGRSPWCADPRHNHAVPIYWIPDRTPVD